MDPGRFWCFTLSIPHFANGLKTHIPYGFPRCISHWTSKRKQSSQTNPWYCALKSIFRLVNSVFNLLVGQIIKFSRLCKSHFGEMHMFHPFSLLKSGLNTPKSQFSNMFRVFLILLKPLVSIHFGEQHDLSAFFGVKIHPPSTPPARSLPQCPWPNQWRRRRLSPHSPGTNGPNGWWLRVYSTGDVTI